MIRMNVYTCTSFGGHWAVGTSAVVVAESKLQAASILEAELAKIGLAQKIECADFEFLDARQPSVRVLNDGRQMKFKFEADLTTTFALLFLGLAVVFGYKIGLQGTHPFAVASAVAAIALFNWVMEAFTWWRR